MKDVQNDCSVPTQTKYPALCELTQDFVAAPASQTCSEREFSLCGDLTDRKRNRASKSLEKRIFLKINKMYM
jgi:hypothetical protein